METAIALARHAAKIEDFERRISGIESAKPDVLAAEVRELRADILEVKDEVKATKRALYTVALSVAGGAITFAFTAFQIWGSAA